MSLINTLSVIRGHKENDVKREEMARIETFADTTVITLDDGLTIVVNADEFAAAVTADLEDDAQAA